MYSGKSAKLSKASPYTHRNRVMSTNFTKHGATVAVQTAENVTVGLRVNQS